MGTIINESSYDLFLCDTTTKDKGLFIDNIPIDKSLMIKDGIYSFYSVNLNKTPFQSIREILDGCEDVENECWNAQENFEEYASKCNFLYYAERDGRISGFFLVSFFIIDQCCIISMDEIMVRKSEQKNKLGLKLALTAFRDFHRIESGNSNFKSVSLLSITPNQKMMNSYSKGSFLTNLRFFDTTFNASDALINIHLKFLNNYEYLLVDDKRPFFIKNAFPGSNKTDSNNTDDFVYTDRLKSMIPEGFDPIYRGDSLCFMMKTSRLVFSLSCILFLFQLFGSRFISTGRLGIWPFNRIK